MKNHLHNDMWLYYITMMASMVGAILQALTGKSTPEVNVALGSAANGGFVGLLAPVPINR